ncbi:hypothetical protein CEE37_14140 [candidate division LCP-89 bacterium B3_LCP]|uniref:Flavinylation-associated cytochrome domain-containing protein n=1 Tax=candidate division LCP-89 bacterium B3_LCP TaxID=2012998 RepID=A0A532UQN9_UNCL8|nr:MAG: hypothetical protein CEE37_14140 [candidate division LCP-89 bacterium B3_LCP]
MTNRKKNIIVDLLSYLGFTLLLGTGLILQYILPHGSGRIAGSGTGRASGEKIITTLWGMSRDQWGEIHFWIAAITLVVLALHLLFHWKWIICVLGRRGKPAGKSGERAVLGLFGLIGILALVLLVFLIPTEQATRNQLTNQTEINRQVDTHEKQEIGVNNHNTSIRGTMTLREIQNMTSVPYEYLIIKLQLPKGISPDIKLGKLKKSYGFSIEDVRQIVEDYPINPE